MSFLSHNADMDARAPQQGLPQLLDVLVGFFVWAAHFLVVYIATALACALNPGAASGDSRVALVTAARWPGSVTRRWWCRRRRPSGSRKPTSR